MKVALVTETYPPEVNGVAMTLSRLVGGLVQRGHGVEIVRPRQAAEMASPAERLRPLGPGVSEYLVRGVPIPFYRQLRMGVASARTLRRRWQTWGPDVVHVATEGPLGLAALRATECLKLPVTSTFHTNFHAYGGHYGMRLLRGPALGYLRWFHNRTACTLVPTDEGVAQLASQGFQRLGVLARGVDGTLFSPAQRRVTLRESWGVRPEDPVIAYVGRLAAEKNLGLAVEAFLAMRAVAPRAKFLLVGDGPERPSLERRHPDFLWAGVRRGSELAAHYASADAFIFPSVTETFGNVVTEAMASGLVVLAYDYASTRQHVRSGRNGVAVPFDDAKAFVRAAVELMQAPATWPGLREAARKTAEGITWDAVVGTFENALEKARRG